MRARSLAPIAGLAASLWSLAGSARAGSFDAVGNYLPDPAAAVFQDFSADFDPVADRYVPADAPPECLPAGFDLVAAADALSGTHVLHVETDIMAGCSERFIVRGLPATQASYRATVWARHGSLDAQLTVVYPEESGRDTVIAKMAPTGRATSDGWVELASNAFPVDGAAAEVVYLRVYDADSVGSDLDALELVPEGEYVADEKCSGVLDPVCGPERLCLMEHCELGRLLVPPLPCDEIRDDVVDMMQSVLRVFFGGRKTRLGNLPEALAALDQLRYATSAWQFWSGWAAAIRRLHDWHTRAVINLQPAGQRRQLNACFVAGVGDTSAAAWPKHPKYDDILVSHTGAEPSLGIEQGDRLVAVDGLHPIEWALSLREQDWGWWQADDDRVYSEQCERMGRLITAYAKSFTVIHCHKVTQDCDPVPVTHAVADLPYGEAQVQCDNRPYYHFEGDANPPADHGVGWTFYQGRIAGTTEDEAIFGLLWDTLYGGGDPNGHVNGHLTQAYKEFKENARGVILDHRAGNGGTLDGAETATTLFRPPETILVFQSPVEKASDDGPVDADEGKALFKKFQFANPYKVGDKDYAAALPVAVLIHRDGSASDFFPFAVKGAPHARLFGPAPTAGAFSTFYNLSPWGPVSLQFASGDSISKAGEPLIGHGVEPDVVVKQRQSDILAGKDSIHEAALAWLREELAP